MQTLDAIPLNQLDHRITCCYLNATSSIQIARITNIESWYFERVVFPGQRLIFDALAEAVLEIYSGNIASSILTDSIPCSSLAIQDALPVPIVV